MKKSQREKKIIFLSHTLNACKHLILSFIFFFNIKMNDIQRATLFYNIILFISTYYTYYMYVLLNTKLNTN